jgi:hypothetical protein
MLEPARFAKVLNASQLLISTRRSMLPIVMASLLGKPDCYANRPQEPKTSVTQVYEGGPSERRRKIPGFSVTHLRAANG